jgi:endonuclease YncB( thermonuclease family)
MVDYRELKPEDWKRLRLQGEEALGIRKPHGPRDVKDGDTYYEGGEKVRIMGVDTPETWKGADDPGQPYGNESKGLLEQLLNGQRMESRARSVDRHGRQLHSAYAGEKDLAVEQVRAGLGFVNKDDIRRLNRKKQKELLAAEAEAKAAKRGVWSKGDDPERPWDYRRRIDYQKQDAFEKGRGPKPRINPFDPFGDEKAEKKEGLYRVLGAIDTPRNVVASGIESAVEAPSGFKWEAAKRAMAQAWDGKRQTEGSDILDAVNRKSGHGKVRFGRDNDGKVTLGDAVDTAAGLGVDILTDPLSLLSGGLSTAARGVAVGGRTLVKPARGLLEAQMMRKAGVEIPKGTRAAKWQAGLQATEAGVGGVMGWGATNEDEPLAARLGVAAAGAIAPAALKSKAAGKLGEAIAERGDRAFDWYYKTTGKVGGAPEGLKKIWALKKKPEDFDRAAVAQADAEVPELAAGFKASDEIARNKKVREVADEIKQQATEALETYALQRADEVIKHRYQKVIQGGKVNPAEFRESIAKVIAEPLYTDGKVSKAFRHQKAAFEKIRGVTSMITQMRHGALEGLDESQRALVDTAMHKLKERFKDLREGVLKEHGYDREMALEGPGLMARIEQGQLTKQELAELELRLDSRFDKKLQEIDELVETRQIDGRTAAERRNAVRNEGLRQTQYLRLGAIPPQAHRDAYGILSERSRRLFDEATDSAKELMKGEEKQIVTLALKDQHEKLSKNVDQWMKNNEDIIKHYNQTVHGLEGGVAKGGVGLKGIRYHIDDVYDPAMFEQVEELLQTAQKSVVHAARKQGSSMGSVEVGPDNSYLIYAKKFASKYLTQLEKESIALVRGAFEVVPGKGLRWEKTLRVFDDLTNFAKANMLYFSFSWLKNNYYDNIAKAWLEGGTQMAVDTATMGKYQQHLGEDMKRIISGDANAFASSKFAHDDTELMFRYGVLDNMTFQALVDHTKFSDRQMKEAIYKRFFDRRGNGEELYKRGVFKKAADWWLSKLENTVGNVGSHIEGAARAVTFIRTKEMLMGTEMFSHQPEKAAQIAAEIVKKTFFDYGDVRAFEKAVLKRIIPFYSFYAKNLPYWVGALTDPSRVGRLAAVEHSRKSVGDDPTAEERKTIEPYLAKNSPRRRGRDKMGNDLFVVSPAMSMDDAFGTLDLSNTLENFTSKANPLLKLLPELLTGHDTFSGDKLYPSQNVRPGSDEGRKYLYSRGYKWVLAQKIMEGLGAEPEALGIKVDKGGNPYATKDNMVLIDKVISTFLPHGAVDQVTGSIGKINSDKETPFEAAVNRFSPWQTARVSSGQRKHILKERKTRRERED